MRVMILVKATTDSERGDPPSIEMLDAMERFNRELIAAGLLDPRDLAGLKPSSEGRRVAFDGSGRNVYDGPFQPVAGIVAGFWIWTVLDMEEAIAWVRRCPNPMPGPSEIEIRPFYEAADVEAWIAAG